MQLVFGERRLRACRDILHWKSIPATIVEMESIAEGELEENLLRMQYTLSELSAIVDKLRGFKHGGDRLTDQRRNCDIGPLTTAMACKRVWSGEWSVSHNDATGCN